MKVRLCPYLNTPLKLETTVPVLYSLSRKEDFARARSFVSRIKVGKAFLRNGSTYYSLTKAGTRNQTNKQTTKKIETKDVGGSSVPEIGTFTGDSRQ